ncbi:hypothetical protein, partial [Scytonema sp. NUACC26]|uniref:hypothetical protein n=1 Tax=Scytonema sp. NUACC26 TaxID=3140176 RepID=UPI0038B27D19
HANSHDPVDELFEYHANSHDPVDELFEYHANSHDPVDELFEYHANSHDPVDELFEYHANSHDPVDELLAEEQEPLATAQSSDNIAVNGVVEHSNLPKKTNLSNKIFNYLFPRRHDISAQNALKTDATTGAQAGASGINVAAEHSHLITHGTDLISGTVGGAISTPLSALGAFRSGRQATIAYQRAQIAQNYTDRFEGESTNEDNSKLAEISQYMAQKQGRRANRLGVSAGFGSASTAAGVASLATGVVTPPGLALGITSAVLGGVSSITSVAPQLGKASYKRYKGTKGKNRKANATELYELAKKGHEPSLQFLQEPKIGILKEGSRPHINTKGFYVEDLQDESKKKLIVKYIQQKMRS